MTYTRKAFVTCNKCGNTEEASVDYDDELSRSCGTSPAEGWKTVKPGRHLCPACADAYDAVEREMRLKLDDAAGIRRIEVELP